MEFKVGDKVILRMGVQAYKLAPKGLQRWDGCIFTVKSVRMQKVSDNNRFMLYELDCCKSPKGVAYTIMEEWLDPVRY